MPEQDRGAPIEVYADGSFSSEVHFGAWAFKVPALNLEGVGSSDGPTVARFEFLAVLSGIEAVIAADNSSRPVEVISDCDSTVGVITLLREGQSLKKPGRYQDRADLLPRLQAMMQLRPIRARRYFGGSLHHQECHRNAYRQLRDSLDSDPRVRQQIVLIKQRALLSQLIEERESLLSRWIKVDEEIANLQVEIEALELTKRPIVALDIKPVLTVTAAALQNETAK
jgi:ribonuclease HI